MAQSLSNELDRDFLTMRKKGTPWCLCLTPDPYALAQRLSKIQIEGKDMPAVWYDCVHGVKDFESDEAPKVAGTITTGGSDPDAPSITLRLARDQMPDWSVLFFCVPGQQFIDDLNIVQALYSVRDAFKSTNRMVVLLARELSMPPMIRDDVPVLYDPLPDEGRLGEMAAGLVNGQNEKRAKDGKPALYVPEANMKEAGRRCKGMTLFAAEEALSRRLGAKGYDLNGLSDLRCRAIEEATGRALVKERQKLTFADIGGMDAFKEELTLLQKGPCPARLIVRVDEVEKTISAAASGAVADNTGVTQDILRTWLIAMEDNGWDGALLAGGPGTGKTISTICAGNEFGVETWVMDFGATKSSLVGASESAVRRVIDVLKTIGGRNVLFLATCNRLDTLPPELQRRFKLGTWLFDNPTPESLKLIWKIQMKAYSLPEQPAPACEGWVGSDVRNCCEKAYKYGLTLVQAAKRITPAAVSARVQVEALRDLAERSGFLCAQRGQPYKKVARGQERRISLDN